MKPGWANGATQDLISIYCFYAVEGERLIAELQRLTPADKVHGKTLRLLRDCTRTINALATRLRLCPSSSRAPIHAYDPAAHHAKPWEDWGHPA
jgi:hypothetical protein